MREKSFTMYCYTSELQHVAFIYELLCGYYVIFKLVSVVLPTTTIQNYGLCALLLCFLGILYAVGGYDGATRQCLSTVEAYNPKSNTWSYIAEMGTRRSGAGVSVWELMLVFGL